jgi:hypothetical protein
VTTDNISIKRQGIRGQIAQRIYGNLISRVLSIYSLIAIASLSLGIWLIVSQNYLVGILLLVIGLGSISNVILSRNNSTTNFIERSSVHLVEAHPPHPPFTRAYFVIHYTENTRDLKRLIMLPGSLSGGTKEYKKALAIMVKMGWYNI